MDLRHVIRLTRPAVRVTYELEEIGEPTLSEALRTVLHRSEMVPA